MKVLWKKWTWLVLCSPCKGHELYPYHHCFSLLKRQWSLIRQFRTLERRWEKWRFISRPWVNGLVVNWGWNRAQGRIPVNSHETQDGWQHPVTQSSGPAFILTGAPFWFRNTENDHWTPHFSVFKLFLQSVWRREQSPNSLGWQGAGKWLTTDGPQPWPHGHQLAESGVQGALRHKWGFLAQPGAILEDSRRIKERTEKGTCRFWYTGLFIYSIQVWFSPKSNNCNCFLEKMK